MSADLKELGYSELPLVEIEFKKLQYIILTAEFFCQKKSSPPIPQTSDIYQT